MPEPGADGDLTVLKSGMQKSIGMFVERMQAVSGQGRSIALDASVQVRLGVCLFVLEIHWWDCISWMKWDSHML